MRQKTHEIHEAVGRLLENYLEHCRFYNGAEFIDELGDWYACMDQLHEERYAKALWPDRSNPMAAMQAAIHLAWIATPEWVDYEAKLAHKKLDRDHEHICCFVIQPKSTCGYCA